MDIQLREKRVAHIVELRDNLKLGFREIAQRVGITTGGVQAAYYRAKRREIK